MKAFAALSLCVLIVALAALALPGCGKEVEVTQADDTGGRPEAVSAYEAVRFTRPAADRWQDQNWMIQVRDGDAEGIGRDGKGKIWEVYYFSPTPEEHGQFLVIYNRGRIWPGVPTRNKGAEKGREIYSKNKPPDFRVDSSEVYTVGLRNGGSEFLEAHPDAQVNVTLRCSADYEAIGEKMPAPKYKWIWDVNYREPKIASEILRVYVDGMNGDFISKEIQKPPS